MLGIDVRAARITWTVFLVVLAIAAVYAVRETLAVFMLAVFLAYVLSPAVEILDQHTPRRVPRTLALATVYLIFVGVVAGVIILLGSRVAEEASNLSQKIPALTQNPDWLGRIPLPGWLEPARARIFGFIQGEFSNSGNMVSPYLKNVGSFALTTASSLLYVVLVPILSFMFLQDGAELREGLLDFLSDRANRSLLDDILADIHTLLAAYIRALVLLAGASFTVYAIFLTIIGVPYHVLLALAAAVLEFIPVVGPLAGGTIMVLVALVSGYPHVLWIVVFWGIYRLFQDYVLSPYLMGSGVEIHPMLILFGVLAGERIAGIPGMFFSVPAIAILRVIFVRARRARDRRKVTPVNLEVI